MEEEDEIQAKLLPRVGEVRRRGSDGESTNSRFHGSWHNHNNSSRIIRVSRASGGKDRHSKVMTSKGLRDRRVRLSVTTAIQFYDLQDRLGYDQPSKAVEWLIKSASDSISELPSLNNFPHENENEIQINANNNNTNTAACSSTSETSKGSGLSLSRSDIRVKARERARVRTAKEKERDKDKDNNNNNESHNHNSVVVSHHHHHPVSKTASFTELLTGGINSNEVVPTTGSPKGVCEEPNRQLQWCSSAPPMDHYFLGASSSRTTTHNIHQHHQYSSSSSGFSLAQIQMGHEAMNHVSAFNQNHSSDPEQMQQQQQFSFIADHQGNGNDYNLNFTMSSGLAGYNRGTLQSNSPSLLPQLHLQRFSPNLDGSSTVPFFFGAAAAAPAMDQNNNNNNNNHQFSSVFDGSRLQLYYADGCRHSDQKGKTKN